MTVMKGYGQVLARFGHALADPTRARVLLALREAAAYPADLADLLGVVLATDPAACPDADQGCC
jgi:hypothetical protein